MIHDFTIVRPATATPTSWLDQSSRPSCSFDRWLSFSGLLIRVIKILFHHSIKFQNKLYFRRRRRI